MKLALILIAVLLLVIVILIGLFVFVIQDVEQPSYRVVAQDGPYEIRDYPALIVAEAMQQGPRSAALGAGFGALARYIFARDRGGERIAMTAPVTQQAAGQSMGQAEERPPERPPNQFWERIAMTAPVTQSQAASGTWTVRFVMPSRYQLGDLPAPGSGKVRLLQIPPQRMAAVRFSGTATDAILAAREQALRSWLAERGVAAAGPATYAYYNDPFTPPFLRRYEVMIAVAGD